MGGLGASDDKDKLVGSRQDVAHHFEVTVVERLEPAHV